MFAATNMAAAVNGTTPAKAVKNLAILIYATRAYTCINPNQPPGPKGYTNEPKIGKSRKKK
jgi:hypothetical protein